MQITDTSYAMNYYSTPAGANNKASGVENNTDNAVSSGEKTAGAENNTQNNTQNSDKNGAQKNIGELSQEEQRLVNELQAADTNVRAHEAAHMAAGGGLTSPASYTYERGPDNKMYAVAGEVGISTGGGNTPQESLNKAQTIRRAALAPADPSPQDLKVAAQATSMEMSARAQIMAEKMAQNTQNTDENSNDTNSQNSTNADNSAGNSGISSISNSGANSADSVGNSGANSGVNSANSGVNPANFGISVPSNPALNAQIASNNQKSVIGAGVNLASLIG